jgi:rhodanese-related sulfurtransferase
VIEEWEQERVVSMSGERPIIDEVDPAEAYRLLEAHPASALIDVRTRAEWAFVGLPDLSVIGRPLWPIEWVAFPSMAQNPDFGGELTARMDGVTPERMFFICRSGSRSMAAAQAVAGALGSDGIEAHCTNVAEGFEGDLDQDGHRGSVNGWKMRGLPWRQN